MICPINEKCKHKDKDVTMLMCNECMANKLNNAKERLDSIVKARMAARQYNTYTSPWMRSYNTTSSSSYDNWKMSSTAL